MRRLKRRIKYKLDPWLIKFSLLLNWPALTAAILASGAEILNSDGQHVVLALRRSVFTQDLKAMAKFSGRIKYVVIEREYLRQIFHYFLAHGEASQVVESNYHVSEIGRDGKEKYYRYLQRLIPVLQHKLGFAAVLAANIGYLEQQELARFCENSGIPFIILHKEGLAALGDLENRVNLNKTQRFIGTKLLLYNELMRQALLKLPLAGLHAAQAEVVGVPRLDFHVAAKKNQQRSLKKLIVFFSFYPSDKFFKVLLPALDEKGRAKVFKRTDEFHRWVIRFAFQNPDYRVVVKTKFAGHYLEYVENIRREFSGTAANLNILNAGQSFDLMKDAEIVLGFNSTTLVEAMLLEKTIISPYFFDLMAGDSWNYFGKKSSLINYARNYNELVDLVLSAEKRRLRNAFEKAEFLNGMIYRADGRASERAETAIINTIKP